MIDIEVKGVLFDMDGVLVSSIGSVNRCWRRWAAEFGVPNAESYDVPHGMRAVDIVRQLRPDLDPAEGLRRIEDLELADLADLKVLAGARDLLTAIPPGQWAIVTSATRRLLVGRLEAAGLPVPELIVSADTVDRGKPDPQPYRRGAELVRAQPGECLVVEDAPSGVQAGRSAGCRVLGVEGTHSREDLLGAGASWIVPALTSVAAASVGNGSLRLSFPEG